VTRTEAREEIVAAIAFYDERSADWLDAVVFIGLKALFGGWAE
jgi:hypothetical protein